MPDYLVKIAGKRTSDSQVEPTERLIRAKNQARAIAHVVKDSVETTVASTDDVIRLTAAGVKLETAE